MAIEFWFEFASTYSYPAALRIESAARAQGVSVAWRAFLLGPIFKQQGWSDSPFNLQPAKGRYMWRDLARICEELGNDRLEAALGWHRANVRTKPARRGSGE